MTDHPKPIARYALPSLTVMHRHGVKGDGVMFEAGWRFVLEDDHEATLAAKDARIAELEREQENSFAMLEMYGVPRERAKRVSNGIDVLATRYGKLDRIHSMTVQELNALRTAIEAKTREQATELESIAKDIESFEYAEEADGIAKNIRKRVDELRALLEKKP